MKEVAQALNERAGATDLLSLKVARVQPALPFYTGADLRWVNRAVNYFSVAASPPGHAESS